MFTESADADVPVWPYGLNANEFADPETAPPLGAKSTVAVDAESTEPALPITVEKLAAAVAPAPIAVAPSAVLFAASPIAIASLVLLCAVAPGPNAMSVV